MKADYRLSNELWGKFVGGIPPEEMHIASSLEIGLAMNSSPQSPSYSCQMPSVNSYGSDVDHSINFPSSVIAYLGMQTPPVDVSFINNKKNSVQTPDDNNILRPTSETGWLTIPISIVYH